MTAPVAIRAAFPPCEIGAPSAAPSVESFAQVLAGTQAEEVAQNTGSGGGDKAKQATPADDEIANKNLVGCPGIVLPPNLIIVPSAPTPLSTPVPDLQTPVAVKQVSATEWETPNQTRVAWVDSVSVQSSTPEQAPLLPSVPTSTKGQVAVAPELIGAQAENRLPSTIPASAQPSRPHASPEVQEPVSTPPPALAKKVELPAEPQPQSPQTPAPAETAASRGIPAENLKELFEPAVMSEATITLSAITTGGEPSDTTASSSRQPAPKEHSSSPVLPDSLSPSAALDRDRSSPVQDPPVQEVVAAAPMTQPAQQQERGSKTRHRTDQKIIGPPTEKTQAMRELHPSPSQASNGASVTGDVGVVENRSGPAQADPSVLINPVRTARETDLRATLPASLKAAPDATSPEPLVLGTVHAAKLMERLGQSEMHVGLRTLVFGSVEVHTVVKGSQVDVSIGAERGDLHSFLIPEVGGLSASIRQHELKLEAVHFFDPSCSFNAQDFSGMRQDQRFYQSPRFPVPAPDVENAVPEISETVTPVQSGASLSVHA